jgi:hypothetical protein
MTLDVSDTIWLEIAKSLVSCDVFWTQANLTRSLTKSSTLMLRAQLFSRFTTTQQIEIYKEFITLLGSTPKHNFSTQLWDSGITILNSIAFSEPKTEVALQAEKDLNFIISHFMGCMCLRRNVELPLSTSYYQQKARTLIRLFPRHCMKEFYEALFKSTSWNLYYRHWIVAFLLEMDPKQHKQIHLERLFQHVIDNPRAEANSEMFRALLNLLNKDPSVVLVLKPHLESFQLTGSTIYYMEIYNWLMDYAIRTSNYAVRIC